MQHWHFKAQADAMIEWLRRRWSEDIYVGGDGDDEITVTVELDADGNEVLK